jgi:UDP-N-acetylglucosamine:LPS N-acetylglucosamine transferase
MPRENRSNPRKRIAFFISSHGFGHAARAAAVMEAISDIEPLCQFSLFTMVPAWFFQNSLANHFTHHQLQTDIGIVQKSPFQEEFGSTLKGLNQLLPYDQRQICRIVEIVKKRECQAVLCDIAPIGILIAQNAGIPSVLIENFTWDWLYESYTRHRDKLQKHISYLRQVYKRADHHVQTQPICRLKTADLVTSPVSRKIKAPRRHIRKKIRVPNGQKLVMITTGGIPLDFGFIDKLYIHRDICFIIPCNCEQMRFDRNLVFLPHHSDFFHPDLINASDAVIGKAGYSTIAEVFHSGVPFGYVPRLNSRETAKLVEFIERHMNAMAIDESIFQTGEWIADLKDLLRMPRIQRDDPNGAVQTAEFILNLIS